MAKFFEPYTTVSPADCPHKCACLMSFLNCAAWFHMTAEGNDLENTKKKYETLEQQFKVFNEL